MELLMINETMDEIRKVSHSFTNEEKEFIVQFAFKTSDRELTNKLIDEIMEVVDEADSIRVMEKFSTMYDVKPAWVNQIENLLVSIEMYRIGEQKAISSLAEILGTYGVDVSEEEIKLADAKYINNKVAETTAVITSGKVAENTTVNDVTRQTDIEESDQEGIEKTLQKDAENEEKEIESVSESKYTLREKIM